jgi:glycosyltransferase involved in cell wall biosynthesis
MNKLTVIIPFLNEGENLNITLNNIRYTAKNNVNIIVINDCSNDNYDYSYIIKKYNVKYIKNKKRKGVAYCRDLGVNMISTPYFILLDSHMKFYENDWWIIAIKALELNERAIYCAACLVLDEDWTTTGIIHYGAYVNYYGDTADSILEPYWIDIIDKTNIDISTIPCVLGASYIMSKRYWEYLKGLALLRYYGSDEVYISSKVWMEGGKCFLLHNLKVGHVFRLTAPYQIINADSVYNKLLISEMIFPENYNKYINAIFKYNYSQEYHLSRSLIDRNYNKIIQIRKYYESIFRVSANDIIQQNTKYNKTYIIHNITKHNIDEIIKTKLEIIYDVLIDSNTCAKGAITGKLSEYIFILKYNIFIYKNIPIKLLNEFKKTIYNIKITNNPYYYDGLAGIGTALYYLKSSNIIDFDIDYLISDNNEMLFKIMKYDLENNNLKFMQGATGIAYYFFISNNINKKYLNYYIEFIDRNISHIKGLKLSLNMDEIIGIILLVFVTYKSKISNIDLTRLIYNLLDYVLQHQCSYIKQGFYYSKNINDCTRTSISWFNGDLIIGYILLKIGLEFNDKNIIDNALSILESTTKRLDPVHENVIDASFCFGSAGIAYLYKQLYKTTNDNKYNKLAIYWMKDVLYKFRNDTDLFCYYSIVNSSEEDQFSILSGISGIGLSMLSIMNNQDNLNDLLLII